RPFLTFLTAYISPDSFTLQTSIVFLLALLFGGLGNLAGPLAGAAALTVLPELLTGLADYRLILYGALLLISIYWLPAGVVGAIAGRARPRGAAAESAAESIAAVEPAAPGPEAPSASEPAALLGVERIGVSFGGVVALTDVTLSVPPRHIMAVIGPNGAGKTTLLNLITGYYRPDSGAVRLGGEAITGLPPYAIARRGVARTFQTAQPFDDLTVVENVMVGVAGPRVGGRGGRPVGLRG